MSKPRKYLQLILCYVLMLFGSMAVRAEKAIEPTAQLLEIWFGEIEKTPMPFNSCFHAAYPETTWTHVECGVGTGKSFRNSFRAIRSRDSEKNQILSSDRVLSDNDTIQTVGGGGPTDWLAYGTNLPTNFSNGERIGATGSFTVVSGVTTEYDVGGGTHHYNDYSVQLNSNYFPTPACNNIPGCLGWEQFVYSSGLQKLLIQFWLLNYSGSCPGGWTSVAGAGCYKDSPSVFVPTLAATGLGTLRMSALSSGSTSVRGTLATSVLLRIGNDAYFTYDDQIDTLSLTPNWDLAEFNIFGDGSNVPQAIFNPGSSITVYTSLYSHLYIPNIPPSPSPAVDSCEKISTTGETNNLNLGACTATPSGYIMTPRGFAPRDSFISFTESN